MPYLLLMETDRHIRFFSRKCAENTLFCRGFLGYALFPPVFGGLFWAKLKKGGVNSLPLFLGHFYYKTGEKTPFLTKIWITEWAVAIYIYIHLYIYIYIPASIYTYRVLP